MLKTSLNNYAVTTYMLKDMYGSETQEQQQTQMIEVKKVIFKNCGSFTDSINVIHQQIMLKVLM